jgi:hypothetical protein
MFDLNAERELRHGSSGIQIENKLCQGVYRNLEDYHLFGIIMLTTEHGTLRKYLNEREYWEQLDKRTGDRWLVFITQDSGKAKPDSSTGGKKQKIGYDSKIEELSGHSHDENIRLLDWFGLKETDLPCLVVFQVIENNSTIPYRVKLKGDSEQVIDKELREICGRVSKVLQKISPENFSNKTEIFQLVKSELRDYNFERMSDEVVRRLSGIANIAKLFRLFFG